LTDSTSRWLTRAWLLVMAALTLAAWAVLPHVTLSESSLLKLLPDAELSASERAIVQMVSAQSSQTSLWLIESSEESVRDETIIALRDRLQESGLFATVGVDATPFREMAIALFPWRYQLMPSSIRTLLVDNPDELIRRRTRELHAPGGMARASNLQDDPFDLFGAWLMTLVRSEGSTRLGTVAVSDQMIILPATLQSSGFDLDTQFKFAAMMTSLQAELESQGLRLRVGGVPAYAAWNAVSARAEVSTVGSGSLLGVLLLVLTAFRSARPLAYAVIAISAGVFAGATVSLLLFERIHMLTWVFGTSLIGIGIDYSLHLLTTAQDRPGWTPALGVDRIFKPTAIGLASSVLGFVALLFTPFPVLREIAAFAIVGLVMAWFTCIALATPLLREYRAPARTWISDFAIWLSVQRDRWMTRPWLVISIVVMVVTPGLFLLTPDDDITALQARDTPVALDDTYIREHLPTGIASQFFLVEGQTAAELISRETALVRKINSTSSATPVALSAVFSLPDDQRKGILLLQEKLRRSGLAEGFFKHIGYSDSAANAEFSRWENASIATLELPDFVRLLAPPWSALWQGCDQRICRSIVLLDKVRDKAALDGIRSPGARLVDQVSLLSSQFARFRAAASLMLIGAIALVIVVLTLAYGFRASLRITLVPCLGLAIALGMLGLTGTLYSVFNLFALLLVFGIGIDYAVFQHTNASDTRAELNRTELAILLSALTTLLSFGLLAVSQTTVISAFGSTLTTGIAACWLLSPLARPGRKKHP
jgi:predicted exporter